MQRNIFQVVMFSVFLLAFNSNAMGQGGADGGGQQGGGQQEAITNIPTGGGTGDTEVNNGGSTGSTVTGNDGVVSDEPNVEIDLSDDIRNQGFVGATAPLIQNGRETEATSAFQRNAGFIGAASDTSGPPVTDGGSFGGGVNDVNGSFSGGGGRGGAAGFGANEVGFPVTRKSVRAVLRPNFYAPRPSPQVVSSRFSEHLARQPGSRTMSGNYSITVRDRTAYISGNVASQYESQRLVRQLKLEPGVYQIVNQLQISN